jgi:hypothetical protein
MPMDRPIIIPEKRRNITGIMGRKPRRLVEFLVVTVFALGLYIPFLSIQYDPNGIIEALAVQNGPLLNKNHMLYRPLGLVAWSALQRAGYTGDSLPVLTVLQVISAVAGALGLGFAFLAFRGLSVNAVAPVLGAVFLGTSFTYWVSATDAFYVTLAGMFAAAALACVVRAATDRWIVAAGILAALSIFTWQGSLFLVPALLLTLPKSFRTIRSASLLIFPAGLLVAFVYVVVAFTSRGVMGPRDLWMWFTHYSENATLSIWGAWESRRVPVAALSALDSITAVRLAAGLRELFHRVQLGRIAVDFSVLAFSALMIVGIAKARSDALRPLAAYLCFFPFIVWWDPGSDKWFLIANIFLAGFLVCSLGPPPQHKYMNPGVTACIVVIAATNFVTTIRPRHFDPGRDRRIAQCVAGHMRPADLFVAAEWGWPDYLPYLHKRATLNLINEFARFQDTQGTLSNARESIAKTHSDGGRVYIENPRSYGGTHLQWLKETTGLTATELSGLGGTPSFVCDDVAIDVIS